MQVILSSQFILIFISYGIFLFFDDAHELPSTKLLKNIETIVLTLLFEFLSDVSIKEIIKKSFKNFPLQVV